MTDSTDRHLRRDLADTGAPPPDRGPRRRAHRHLRARRRKGRLLRGGHRGHDVRSARALPGPGVASRRRLRGFDGHRGATHRAAGTATLGPRRADRLGGGRGDDRHRRLAGRPPAVVRGAGSCGDGVRGIGGHHVGHRRSSGGAGQHRGDLGRSGAGSRGQRPGPTDQAQGRLGRPSGTGASDRTPRRQRHASRSR